MSARHFSYSLLTCLASSGTPWRRKKITYDGYGWMIQDYGYNGQDFKKVPIMMIINSIELDRKPVGYDDIWWTICSK